MPCYVDFTSDVTKLPQFDKIKEISDLENAILADGVDFGYKRNVVQLTFDNKTYYFKMNKINWSSYIENIEFFDYNFQRKKDSFMFIPHRKN